MPAFGAELLDCTLSPTLINKLKGIKKVRIYFTKSSSPTLGIKMRFLFNLAAIAGLTTVGVAATVPGLSKRAEDVKIMPLGDSITGSPVLHPYPF